MTEHARPSPFTHHLYGPLGLAALIVLYLLPGSIGHDPWRGDDIRHFMVVRDLLQGDTFWWPAAEREPIPGHGPLYYWVSGLFGLALGWLMPLHDATRLASPFFTGLAIFWISRTSTRLHGRHTRTAAALLALGTLGLVIHAHEHQPLTALIATQAMTLAGLALLSTQPIKGGLQAGLGCGLAFLAGGPHAALITVPLILMLLMACSDCRHRHAVIAAALGLAISAILVIGWLHGLAAYTPQHFQLWQDNLTWSSAPLKARETGKALELAAWSTWPLWPIAGWTIWKMRHQLLQIAWTLPLSALFLALLWLQWNSPTEPSHYLPMIVPLAVLAAAGVPKLRRGAANAFDWFAFMTFGTFALLVWLAWSAQAFEWPPGLTRSLNRMAPDFILTGSHLQALVGLLITIAWLCLVYKLPKSPNRGPANWAMGMTMLWCLAVTLLLPWFDHSRSYRAPSESLARALESAQPACIAGQRVDANHRAAFEYFSGIRMAAADTGVRECARLVVRNDLSETRLPDNTGNWIRIWEFNHAGGKRLERFELYQLDHP